jgi:predicted negative regulator of RcsB-dependent stress response
MAASDRRQVQQQLKQPDPFFEAIAEAREYFETNRSKVLGVGGGLAALFIVVVGGSNYYFSQGRAAATSFASAVSDLQAGETGPAEVDLKTIPGRSNAGPYKALSSLYLANIAAEAGRNEEAATLYDQFQAAAPTEYLRQIGLMGKAAALEKTGKAPEAAAALDQAATIDGPYRKAALSDRARLAEAAGDKSTAIANLQKLLEMEGSTGDSSQIERRIQALK